MKTTLLAIAALFSISVSAAECRVQGYATGFLSAGWTEWKTVAVDSLESCTAAAEVLLGRELEFGYHRVVVVAGKFRYADGRRVIDGEVRLAGRRGD